MKTLTDNNSLHRDGFLVDSETSPEGDLIAVIIETEGLQAGERETLERHYSRVIDLMETFTPSAEEHSETLYHMEIAIA
jgi:hypothetical protein